MCQKTALLESYQVEVSVEAYPVTSRWNPKDVERFSEQWIFDTRPESEAHCTFGNLLWLFLPRLRALEERLKIRDACPRPLQHSWLVSGVQVVEDSRDLK